MPEHTFTGILCGALLLAAIGLWYQSSKIDTLQEAYTSLQKEYEFAEAVWKENESKLKISVDSLNSMIEKYKIDAEQYHMCVNEKVRELSKEHEKKEEDILKELEKDSSSDNTLKLIEEMLYGLDKDNR